MSNRVGVPTTSGGVGNYPVPAASRTTSMSVSTTSGTFSDIKTQTTSTSGGLNGTVAICYNTCNNAYSVAISIGNVDELCKVDGDFIAALNSCVRCIDENKKDSDQSLPDELRQITSICAGGLVFTTDTFLMRDGTTSTITHLVNISSTSTMPSTSIQSASTTSAPAATSSAAASGPSSNAWIAGPVVGGIAGLGIAILAGLWFWRRRSRRPSPALEDEEHFDKAQLHSDCIPKPMHEAADGAIHEMQASLPLKITAEKAANEPPCYELPADDTRPQSNHPPHPADGA
ncbi:unnamed protein product [Clonostachys rosea]|uniref:Mid2 domain-containing protein n=1 Tax=Bionectria ochroleuca TaxID=29856 RepID=A0ABY6TRV7_BIOOC|nr:unnamed protein product [Clonostachys rosea]